MILLIQSNYKGQASLGAKGPAEQWPSGRCRDLYTYTDFKCKAEGLLSSLSNTDCFSPLLIHNNVQEKKNVNNESVDVLVRWLLQSPDSTIAWYCQEIEVKETEKRREITVAVCTDHQVAGA